MSDVAVKAIREQLKTMLESVDDAKTVALYAPRNLETGHCPAFLIVPANADHERAAGDFHRTDRNWRIILLVGKNGEGVYGDLQKKLDQFFERIEDLFFANMRLDALDGQVYYSRISGDTGEALIEFPPRSGQEWIGCEWVVTITLSRVITAGQ
jgi:hypothetical protein